MYRPLHACLEHNFTVLRCMEGKLGGQLTEVSPHYDVTVGAGMHRVDTSDIDDRYVNLRLHAR